MELFFDLVFVFAVTQITTEAAHNLTPDVALRAILVGRLIWWAWTPFTWTLNPADTTHDRVRVITLAATAAAFALAASVPRAFTGEALWFALPYVVVRLLGLGLQVIVDLEREGTDHEAAYRWTGASLAGLVLVVAGALADPGLRSLLWLGAIGADFAAAMIGGTASTRELVPAHISERQWPSASRSARTRPPSPGTSTGCRWSTTSWTSPPAAARRMASNRRCRQAWSSTTTSCGPRAWWGPSRAARPGPGNVPGRHGPRSGRHLGRSPARGARRPDPAARLARHRRGHPNRRGERRMHRAGAGLRAYDGIT